MIKLKKFIKKYSDDFNKVIANKEGKFKFKFIITKV